MARLPSLPFESDIDYLVNEAFPHLNGFGKLASAPGSDSLNTDFNNKIAAAKLFREELEKKPKPELRALVLEARKRDEEKKRRLLEQTEAARFFHQPNAAADFGYWAKISYWKIDEAVALSFGKDPRIVNWERISSLVKISTFAFQYAAKRELAERAKTANQISLTTPPSTFLAWATRTKFEVPAELEAAVTAMGIQIADWKTLFDKQVLVSRDMQDKLSTARTERLEDGKKYLSRLTEHSERSSALVQTYLEKLETLKRHNTELQYRLDELGAAKPTKAAKDLPPRERETVLKLILGMAVAFYGYDPRAGRSLAISQIQSDLALKGVKIDDGTIRKYLDEAKALWPFE